MTQKVCAVPYRWKDDALTILAFRHPLAGNQFVKGTIEPGETPDEAAVRELREESGLTPVTRPFRLGDTRLGSPLRKWHFYAFETVSPPETWDHRAEDDGGHVFSFFWLPLAGDLTGDWHPMFHQAFRFIRNALPPVAR